jgi:hypothetical protein
LSLLQVFQWCEGSTVGTAIRSSSWLFPVIEAFHLLALGLVGGAVLLVDFRLFGMGLRRQPMAQVALDAQPWLVGGLATMILSGFLLFFSESVKCYYSWAFRTKMLLLLLAVVFTFTVRRRAATADEPSTAPLWNKIVAVVSLTLWLGVGVAGRWIGFS